MTLKRVLQVVAFAVVGFSQPATAETETFLVYVAPTLKHPAMLSPAEHVLSFSTPVEIPRAYLPAGPYIFRFLGPSIVQVQSVTRSKVYATFFTIPTSGIGDTSRERIKFELTGEGRPPRIAAWYLPWSTGHEFLYPKPKRRSREREEQEIQEGAEAGWR